MAKEPVIEFPEIEDDRPAGRSGARPHIDDVIGDCHHFRLVFHNENRVSNIAKLGQRLIESLNVVRVQTDGRLIEDVERLRQAGRQMAHHLDPLRLQQFLREALRVSRRALLINDLVRHPLHLALVYASFPLMRNRVAWLDGLASVRRAYMPNEIREMLTHAFSRERVPRVEISRHYLFRMGVIVWKTPAEEKRAD